MSDSPGFMVKQRLATVLRLNDAGRADLEAWLGSGERDALSRLLAPARDLSNEDLKSLVMTPVEDQGELLARCLELARGMFPASDLRFEIVRRGTASWALACHRDLEASRGAPPPSFPAPDPAQSLEQATRLALASALRSDERLFAELLRRYDRPEQRLHAHALVKQLGTVEREEGSRVVARVDAIVSVLTKVGPDKTCTLHFFEDEAAAKAFVEGLPALTPAPAAPSVPPRKTKKQKPTLERAEGFVSIWIDTELDPKGKDGEGGPVGWYDHDRLEGENGPAERVLTWLSYSASFAAAAIARLRELGLEKKTRVDALYATRYTAEPGPMPKKKGWFLGTFPYDPKAGPSAAK